MTHHPLLSSVPFDVSQFFFVDDLGTVLSAVLPAAASHVYYIGLKRSGGSAYGFCLDCDGNANLASIQIVDGNDPTLVNQTEAQPVILFSSPLDPSSRHELIMLNLPDNRFDSASEVTLASLLVTVESDETSVAPPPPTTIHSTRTSTSDAGTVTSSSPSSSTLISTTASLSLSLSSVFCSPSITVTAISPSNSLAPKGSNSANDTTPVKGVSSSLIAVIVALSSVGLISLLVGLFIFFRKRNRRIRKRVSEPMSFKDRMTDQFGTSMMETDSVGPLAAAGRKPPPRRQYGDEWQRRASIAGVDSPGSRISQNLWLTRQIPGNQV
ncbi:hypothetical protein BDZ89DRAFT_1157513 [Hymenopellis radicata]|nr:hypothetical protein BDZ89DRAFT_1157513 [Hymenopellis radicata]